MNAKTTFPGGSKLKNFILSLLVFELKEFEPSISFSVFGLETRITLPIAPKICTKVVPRKPYLISEFQVSTFGSFEVIAILASGYKKNANCARKKNIETSDAKRCGSPNKSYLPMINIFCH